MPERVCYAPLRVIMCPGVLACIYIFAVIDFVLVFGLRKVKAPFLAVVSFVISFLLL